MNIEWYPGHMARAKRIMKEDIKNVDLIIELLDARAPESTVNPDLSDMIGSKKRLRILNKSDLADSFVSSLWLKYFNDRGISTIKSDTRNISKKSILKSIDSLMLEKRLRDKNKGIQGFLPIRAMVLGIPNVGKSTFINALSRGSSLKTGDKPGITRGSQWINAGGSLLVLDTPGVLYPKIGDERISQNLALIGSINDDLIDFTSLSLKFISYLKQYYPSLLKSRYDMGEIDSDEHEILKKIALRRGAVRAGGEADTEKAGKMIIEDFRKKRIGKISLERPKVY